MEPTVFIVDDDLEVRTALNQLLRSAKLNSKCYSSAFEFLEDYRPEMSGCLVLDIRMPGMSGLELQSRMADNNFDLPVIIITGYGEVPMVVQAMRTGAFDFIQKPYAPMELLNRIQSAVERDLDKRSGKVPAQLVAARLATLTLREQATLDWMLEQATSAEIAEQLGVSVKTAQVYERSVLQKLQVESNEQLRELMFPKDLTDY